MDESVHLPAAAYALDALDAGERAAYERHLAGCGPCRDDVRAFHDSLGRLAAADIVQPPAAMKRRVLEEVARTAQLASDRRPAARHRRRAWRTRTTHVLAAAAALLAVLAASLAVLLAQSHSRERQATAQVREVAAVLAAPDATTVHGDVTGGGRAIVAVAPSQETAAVVAAGLSQPPSGHVYELWFIDASGAATPAGTFVPSTDGTAAQTLEGQPGDASVVGLTVEPAGGSSAPTTKPVLAVPIAG